MSMLRSYRRDQPSVCVIPLTGLTRLLHNSNIGSSMGRDEARNVDGWLVSEREGAVEGLKSAVSGLKRFSECSTWD
jgi:hypothetical protein